MLTMQPLRGEATGEAQGVLARLLSGFRRKFTQDELLAMQARWLSECSSVVYIYGNDPAFFSRRDTQDNLCEILLNDNPVAVSAIVQSASDTTYFEDLASYYPHFELIKVNAELPVSYVLYDYWGISTMADNKPTSTTQGLIERKCMKSMYMHASIYLAHFLDTKRAIEEGKPLPPVEVRF